MLLYLVTVQGAFQHYLRESEHIVCFSRDTAELLEFQNCLFFETMDSNKTGMYSGDLNTFYSLMFTNVYNNPKQNKEKYRQNNLNCESTPVRK